MKKIFPFITLFLLLNSCTSFKINLALKIVGVYDDTVKLSKLTTKEKEVVFIPMHHLGTVLFYNDVKAKIDSLKKSGFYFYTEEVKGNKKDSITIRKIIKLTGIPFSRDNSGYKHFFDSLYNGKVKLKKELINQPNSWALGLDSLNSKKVDITFKEMIDYYEKKYGELKLRPCDFEKSFYEKPSCKDKPIDKKIRDEVIVGYRNTNVINAILSEKCSKIAIIYGSEHIIGIREELVKKGFK
jgi:hypothetical protein